jgi:hypothetical protein
MSWEPIYCPTGCGGSAVQFLVGRGAFCLTCGTLIMPCVPGDPWTTRTLSPDEIGPDTERENPKNLSRLAVDDAMSGRTRLHPPFSVR